MTSLNNRPATETPWEFLTDPDERLDAGVDAPVSAEDAAMRVEATTNSRQPLDDTPDSDDLDDPVVVHYLDDEEPEVPDVSLAPVNTDVTTDVEDLLIQQHYL